MARPPAPPAPTYLHSSQVAALLHVSPKTVTRWAKQGKLPVRRTLGGHGRYPEAPSACIRPYLERQPASVWPRNRNLDALGAVQLAELARGPITYRVFLLSDALQLDLSMTPAAQFRPAGPRFRLLFGEMAAGEPEVPMPAGALLALLRSR